jgi:hypothetical protein
VNAFETEYGLSTNKLSLRGTDIFHCRLLRVALVALAGLGGTASADAAVFWSDEDPSVAQPLPSSTPRRTRTPKRATVKSEKQVKESKPVGPLLIAISVDQQTLKLYDANGLFAETRVSTGMRGHSTPMGVFSVIQKSKYHRSNIYSGAPMPFMQRITWSGIALHAGVLPGYPASHGCIRMPMAFATKMWGWTRMGARVVITPGEISPSEFAHPLLEARIPGAAGAATEVKVRVEAKAEAAMTGAPTASSSGLALTPSGDAAPARTASDKRDQTVTADASGAMATTNSISVSDAPPANIAESETVTRRDVDTAAARTVETAISAPLLSTSVNQPSATPDASVQAEASKDEVVGLAAPTGSVTTSGAANVKKDETRPPDAAKPVPAADAAPRRTGQIAVFVSSKDNKIYVRQNFAPLFESPIRIAAGERPLGTHVFTARADKDDARTFLWTALSLPVAARRADEDNRTVHRRKSTGAIEVKAMPQPKTAAAALDRLTIPAEAMAQINEALKSGGSIIVSDQGIAAGGETGQGTEFVVPLR